MPGVHCILPANHHPPWVPCAWPELGDIIRSDQSSDAPEVTALFAERLTGRAALGHPVRLEPESSRFRQQSIQVTEVRRHQKGDPPQQERSTKEAIP